MARTLAALGSNWPVELGICVLMILNYSSCTFLDRQTLFEDLRFWNDSGCAGLCPDGSCFPLLYTLFLRLPNNGRRTRPKCQLSQLTERWGLTESRVQSRQSPSHGATRALHKTASNASIENTSATTLSNLSLSGCNRFHATNEN